MSISARLLALFVSVAAVFATTSASRGADLSVQNVRLGDEIDMIVPKLPQELMVQARLGFFSLDGKEKMAEVTAGGRCGWAERARVTPCLDFHAIAGDGATELSDSRVIRITVRQFFEFGIDPTDFSRQLDFSYGVSTSVTTGTDVNKSWLWTNDPSARTPDNSVRLAQWLQTQDTWSQLGWEHYPLKTQALRVTAYIRDGLVRGMEMELFDPERLGVRMVNYRERKDLEDRDSRQKSIDQLRFK